MWKTTLLLNTLVLALFWLLGQVAITPIDNLLVQYAETRLDLPLLTAFAIAARDPSLLLPLAWALLSLWLARRLAGKPDVTRNAWLLAHAAASVFLGLVVLIFFALAGILPILKIGPIIS